jgi:type IV secretory pathway TrbF-like protein
MCVYVHFESMSFLFEFLRCGSLIYVITNTIADVSVRVRFMSLMLDIMKEAQSRDESEVDWSEVHKEEGEREKVGEAMDCLMLIRQLEGSNRVISRISD